MDFLSVEMDFGFAIAKNRCDISRYSILYYQSREGALDREARGLAARRSVSAFLLRSLNLAELCKFKQ